MNKVWIRYASREDQHMYQQLLKCDYLAHIVGLRRLPDFDVSTTEINNIL